MLFNVLRMVLRIDSKRILHSSFVNNFIYLLFLKIKSADLAVIILFSEWLVRQFANFNVLTMIVIVLFNYLTTTTAVNRQMKENKLYDELDEIKEEINRNRADTK